MKIQRGNCAFRGLFSNTKHTPLQTHETVPLKHSGDIHNFKGTVSQVYRGLFLVFLYWPLKVLLSRMVFFLFTIVYNNLNICSTRIIAKFWRLGSVMVASACKFCICACRLATRYVDAT